MRDAVKPLDDHSDGSWSATVGRKSFLARFSQTAVVIIASALIVTGILMCVTFARVLWIVHRAAS